MEWINDIKDRFSKRRIRSLDRTKDFKRDFVDIESAKRVGLIVNVSVTPEHDLALIEEYVETLKGRQKQLMLIEINNEKKSEPRYTTFQDYIFVNPTNLNWLDYPVPTLESQIQAFDLDILMDFDPSKRLVSKYICSLSRARTRTGLFQEGLEDCYELMISPGLGMGPNFDMREMIKEFDYFLNMIDNGNRVKV